MGDRSLDWFASSPMDDPLTYPGLIPDFSYVLTGARTIERVSAPDPRLTAGRHPVIAVGSNAAPAQLARKFFAGGVTSVVPVLRASAPGLRVLPSAHLSIHGYLPYAPFAGAGEASVFVTFLDDVQLNRLDETEPNYMRMPWPEVRLTDTGRRLSGCGIYQSKHGVITDERVVSSGQLPAQAELLANVLGLLPELRSAGITDVADLVASVRARSFEASAVTALIKQRFRVG